MYQLARRKNFFFCIGNGHFITTHCKALDYKLGNEFANVPVYSTGYVSSCERLINFHFKVEIKITNKKYIMNYINNLIKKIKLRILHKRLYHERTSLLSTRVIKNLFFELKNIKNFRFKEIIFIFTE